MGFFLKAWKSIQERARALPSEPVAETIGVDLGQSHLLVLALDKRTERPEISHFRLESRPSSPEAVSDRLQAIFQEEGLAASGIRVALKGQGTVIRVLSFPQMKESDFTSFIHHEVEKYIPFKANEVMLDFKILRENIAHGDSKLMETLLVAAKQSEIYQLLRIFQNADLEVDVIDLSAFALANVVEFASPEPKEIPIGFLDMGAETSTLGILLQGKPIFIREISFGGTDLLKLLKRKLGLEEASALAMQQDSSHFTTEYRQVVEQGLAALLTELKVSLGYYLDHVAGAEPIQSLFILGGGFRFIPDPSFFEQAIKIPTRRPEVFSRIGIRAHLDPEVLKKNEDLLPVAVGLCLRP